MRSRVAILTMFSAACSFVCGCPPEPSRHEPPPTADASGQSPPENALLGSPGAGRCPAGADDDGAPPAREVAAHLQRLSGAELYLRKGKTLEVAPIEDLAVVRGYPTSRTRGPIVEGRRVTVLTKKRAYSAGEEIRVIHVLEVLKPGEELWVMGPKPVVGEFLDDKLVSDPVPEWGAFTMAVYDGAVLKSPGVDINFEITSYRIAEPGAHIIEWRAGKHRSNRLCVTVEK